MENNQEDLINQFVKGPSDSANTEKEISHVIGALHEKDSSLDDSPKLNKHGLELKDF